MVNILILLMLAACNGSKKSGSIVAQNSNSAELSARYQLNKIKLPPGFQIQVYAEVPNARSMCMSPSGVVYVGNRSERNVYAVVDENKDGKGDKVYVVAEDFDTPNGVAFKNGHLYFSTISSIYRIKNIEANLAAPPAPELVYDKFPSDKHHGWKYIAFGPDGKLYVPVGDPSNISIQKNPVYSTITRMNDDGTGMEIYAKGIRNSVGFQWHPQTQKLWFTDNGRDQVADNMPGDELNYAPEPGMHFGHPYCMQGNQQDPQFGKGKQCSDYSKPVQILDPHVAALGLKFYTGTMFDSSYKNKIFIAEHGSWNRSQAIGYRVTTVKLDENNGAKSYETFADGWLQPDGKVLGRPVDVLVMPDGALLVSDDYSGAIYRISKI